MSLTSPRWLFVAIGAILLLAAPAQAGPITKKTKIRIPAGWQSIVNIKWTKDEVVIESETQIHVNDTSDTKDIEDELEGPADANDMHYKSLTKKIPAPPIDEKAASVNFPDLVPNLASYLAANGFTSSNPFDMPIVYGDVNGNGQLDDLDASVYGSVLNVSQYSAVAHASNFPIDSLLTTNAGGTVAGLPGIAFYSDEALTTPYANGSLLVFGTDSTYVPEPSTLCLAAALSLLTMKRRRRSVSHNRA